MLQSWDVHLFLVVVLWITGGKKFQKSAGSYNSLFLKSASQSNENTQRSLLSDIKPSLESHNIEEKKQKHTVTHFDISRQL